METTSFNTFYDFITKAVDKKEITNDYLKNLSVWLRTKEHSLHVAQTPEALELSVSLLSQSLQKNNLTFIDLKPRFKNSSKARAKKNGGWYLVVPVGGVHKVQQTRNLYGRSTWDRAISNLDFNKTFSGNSALTRKIQGKLQQGEVIPELQYQWKSSSITRVQKGSSGTRGQYLTFRTVSDKSSPMSWIVGRQNLSNQIRDNNSHNERQLGSYIASVINAYIDSYSN